MEIIEELRQQRIADAERMQQLQTENARLIARVTILEHTDLKVAELGSRVEQLLQKYLEAEQIRTQQAAQISELRQEIIVLKARFGSQESGAKKRTAEARSGKT
jgi:DNA repair exonuclease SbcCD ATPase subunit